MIFIHVVLLHTCTCSSDCLLSTESHDLYTCHLTTYMYISMLALAYTNHTHSTRSLNTHDIVHTCMHTSTHSLSLSLSLSLSFSLPPSPSLTHILFSDSSVPYSQLEAQLAPPSPTTGHTPSPFTSLTPTQPTRLSIKQLVAEALYIARPLVHSGCACVYISLYNRHIVEPLY